MFSVLITGQVRGTKLFSNGAGLERFSVCGLHAAAPGHFSVHNHNSKQAKLIQFDAAGMKQQDLTLTYQLVLLITKVYSP